MSAAHRQPVEMDRVYPDWTREATVLRDGLRVLRPEILFSVVGLCEAIARKRSEFCHTPLRVLPEDFLCALAGHDFTP